MGYESSGAIAVEFCACPSWVTGLYSVIMGSILFEAMDFVVLVFDPVSGHHKVPMLARSH